MSDLPGAGGAGGGDDDDVVRLEATRRHSRARGRARRRSGSTRGPRCGWCRRAPRAAGRRHRRAARAGRRPRSRHGGCRRSVVQACASRSRKSAPQSITVTDSGSWAARAAECPCGRARNTTSWPASTSSGGVLEDAVGQRRQVRVEVAQARARRWNPPSAHRSRPQGARAGAGGSLRRRSRSHPRLLLSSCCMTIHDHA